jgi:FKBP-type peptidyl-prolyl cis-trans isomerase SlyD
MEAVSMKQSTIIKRKQDQMSSQVISFNYKLTDKSGKELDASEAGHPLIFMTGAGQIIPGLESTLVAMNKGDKKTVTVLAKEAYGEHNPQMIYKVKSAQLPKADINIGDIFEAGSGEQYFPVSVVKIEGDDITLDGNHPLAGQDLTFAVDIVEKREATAEELAHGHVHGAGGCHH